MTANHKTNTKSSAVMLWLMLLIIPFGSIAQTYNQIWDKTYGGASRDWNCTAFTSPTGSLFFIGDSQTDANGDKTSALCGSPQENSDIWLMKVNQAGNIVWQRSYGGSADERLPKLVFTNNSNGEMLMVCHSSSDISCDKTEPNRDTVPVISNDYWICLLDSNGAIIWEKTYGGEGYDENVKAVQLASGEFLICGESKSPAGYDKSVPNYSISNDYWALKLDPAGNKMWDRVYGGNNGEFFTGLIAESDGGFTLSGSTNSDVGFDISQPGQGNLDFWIIRLDANGDKVLDKRFGGSGPEKCNSIIKTNDNGYLLTGFTVSPQSGDVSQPPKGLQDYWVVRTDSVGNKLWDQRYGGSGGSFGTHGARSIAGRFWISGYTNSSATGDVTDPSFGGSDYWTLLIDAAGSKIWDKRWGGAADELNPMITSVNDSVLIVMGQSDSAGSSVKTAPSKGGIDYWAVKFGYADQALGLAHASIQQDAAFGVFPNPNDGHLKFIVPTRFQQTTEPIIVKVMDAAGRMLFSETVSSNITIQKLQLNRFENGFYQLILVQGKEIVKSSFVMAK